LLPKAAWLEQTALKISSHGSAWFLDFARASAHETKALLRKGLKVGYWPEGAFRRLDSLANRGIQAVAKFQRYLRSPQAKRNAARRYQSRRKNDPNVKNGPNDPNDLDR
jgi:hypothetical protein